MRWSALDDWLGHEPVAPEAPHGVDDRQERLALLGELVLDARRRLGVAAAHDDPLVLERPEALGEGSRADPAARVLELRETPRTLGEVVHENRRPLRTDDLRTSRHRARGRLVHRVHRPHVTNLTRRGGMSLRSIELPGRPSPTEAGCAPSGRRPSSPPPRPP